MQFCGKPEIVFNVDISKHSAVWHELPCGNYLSPSESGDVTSFCLGSAGTFLQLQY
jgi:hypothetical protein